MKTYDLIGTPLDWAVAKCEGWTYRYDFKYGNMYFPPKLDNGETTRWESLPPNYSNNWKYGGPIIEREKIETYSDPEYDFDEPWVCYIGSRNNPEWNGPTPLIAAMRCYVASKLGAEIEVPKELQQQKEGLWKSYLVGTVTLQRQNLKL